MVSQKLPIRHSNAEGPPMRDAGKNIKIDCYTHARLAVMADHEDVTLARIMELAVEALFPDIAAGKEFVYQQLFRKFRKCRGEMRLPNCEPVALEPEEAMFPHLLDADR